MYENTTTQRGYASAKLLMKLESLKGTLADPKSVLVSAVFAAAGRLSHAINGCWPPRVPVKPSLEDLVNIRSHKSKLHSHRKHTDD